MWRPRQDSLIFLYVTDFKIESGILPRTGTKNWPLDSIEKSRAAPAPSGEGEIMMRPTERNVPILLAIALVVAVGLWWFGGGLNSSSRLSQDRSPDQEHWVLGEIWNHWK